MTLIAYLPMNESSGTNVQDYSGNENNAVAENNATAGSSGILAQNAYDFDGALGTKLDFGESLLNTSNSSWAYTVSAWVYADSFPNSSNSVFSQYNWDVNQNGRWNLAQNGDLYYGRRDPNVDIYGNPVPTGEWHHIVATKDENQNVTLYQNAVETGSGSDGGSFSSSVNTTIGNSWYDSGAGNTSNGFDGRICEARFYNHALTPHEVQYLYQVTQQGHMTSRASTL
jgi:hypothetical protein